jgi:hypothetical protein
MVLVGIMGKKGCGKDTVGYYLQNKHNFVKTAFATPLKDACKILFMLNDEQVNGDLKETPDESWYKITPRKIMQFVGTELLRDKLNELIPELGNNFHTYRFKLWYLQHQTSNVVITDVRFQNEVDMIHSLGGYVIKLNRIYPLNNTDNTDNHISEKELENINNYDDFIDNSSSLDNLYKNVDISLNKITL